MYIRISISNIILFEICGISMEMHMICQHLLNRIGGKHLIIEQNFDITYLVQSNHNWTRICCQTTRAI